MKALRRLSRSIRDAFKSVIRNFSLSIASISCITITLVVVSLSIIVSYNIENSTMELKQTVGVVIFLDADVTEKENEEIKSKIMATNNINTIEYKSKDTAAKEFADKDPAFQYIIDGWDDNPLLDSYVIKMKDIDTIVSDVETIKNIKGVNSVNYSEDVVAQLVVIYKVVEKASMVAVIALILVAAFLISNTIKLTIFSRKTEIEIMRLVGASNFAIKFPFLIEGLFLGIMGSIIPIGLTIYGYNVIYDFFGGRLFNSTFANMIKPYPFVWTTSALLLLIGVLVGMFGSYRASRKYLKI